jgi:uncharacterized membrane protein YgdD (TMEM256/DUF423 family)
MARLTLLFTLVVLALPSAALASSVSDRDLQALGNEYYYRHSHGTAPTAATTAAPPVPTGHSGPSWLGAAALGAALVLLAGGVGAYGARTLRPRRVRT